MNVVKIRTKEAVPDEIEAQETAGNESRPVPMKTPEISPPPAKPRALVMLTAALRTLLPPLLGFALFVALWALIARESGLPDPVKTWNSAVKLFSDPFYQKGPN